MELRHVDVLADYIAHHAMLDMFVADTIKENSTIRVHVLAELIPEIARRVARLHEKYSSVDIVASHFPKGRCTIKIVKSDFLDRVVEHLTLTACLLMKYLANGWISSLHRQYVRFHISF
jgi:hypothetical protein